MNAIFQVELKRIYRQLRSHQKNIIQDVSFHASPGSVIDITGTSGSGKTTLLLALNLQVPFEGFIRFGDKKHDAFSPPYWRATISYLPSKIQPVSQSIKSFLLYPFSFRIHREKKTPSIPTILSLMKELACPLSLDENIQEVSLGQQYRLSFLRLYLLQPSVYLLDEPFANLDPENMKRLHGILQREAEKGKIVIRGMHTTSEYPAHQTFDIKEGKFLTQKDNINVH